MNKVKIWIAAAAILLGIVAILLYNRSRSTSELKSDVLLDVPVNITVATKRPLQENLSLVGTIIANNDVNVVSETQGRITAVGVKVGEYVSAGTVLVKVDDELKQANLAAAEVNYEKAKKDYERYESLLTKKTITQAQFDGARLAFKSAESQYTVARRQVDDTRITSPIAGYVTSRPVDIGAMVQPGTVVANVVDISTLKVKLNVAEKDAFKLAQGDRVEVTTEVYPGVTFEGKITSVSAKGDEAHTYPVEVAIPNSKEHPLKAGMFARVLFTSIAATDVIAVPREVLVGSIKDPRVFVVQGRVARLRPIVVGSVAGNMLSVTQGLSEGERVVVNGQNNLRDSTSVLVVEEGAGQ